MRRLGRDAECAQALRQLFYQVRDGQRWHAEQILVMVDEWGLGEALGKELRCALPPVGKGEATIDEKLRGGAEIRLLFIGGNEIQARYDAAIAQELSGEWPGVTVHFEHSGWSSNWGRELPRLIDLANDADAVVLMQMMRTQLGRRLREALKKPWISCNATGKGGILQSLRRAGYVAMEQRLGHSAARP
jgi:hypothetical protein